MGNPTRHAARWFEVSFHSPVGQKSGFREVPSWSGVNHVQLKGQLRLLLNGDAKGWAGCSVNPRSFPRFCNPTSRPRPPYLSGTSATRIFCNHASDTMQSTFESGNRGMQAGQVFGNVHFTQAAPERPETPPRPFASIPFSRDPDFVNRGDILSQLHQRCSEPAGRVALCGLGGIGKSQLAIELAYQISERRPNSWIFWIHAATQARVEEGFRNIADTVKLPGRNAPDANIPQLVHSWLSQNRNGRWTIVLDSADDSDTLCQTRGDGKGKSLASYLPQSPSGSIVITTRNRDLGFKLTGSYKDIIQIGPMGAAEALRLLKNRLGPLRNPETAKKLAEELDCVPLAISQAAAYIQATPTSSVEKYLADFRSNDSKRSRLLRHDAAEFRRDGAASNAILTTWQISFDHIRSHRNSAADLLSLISFFDRQGIPLSLLGPTNTRAEQQDSDFASGTWQATSAPEDNLEGDIAMLRSFCLLSITEDGTALEMHALVQLATRMWLDQADGQQRKFHQLFLERMAAAFPVAKYEAWEQCRQLFSHVKAAEIHGPANKKAREWEGLMRNGGRYAYLQGNYKVAEGMVRNAQISSEERLGKGDEWTLSITRQLAKILLKRGLWSEAELMLAEVVEARKAKFGTNHSKTLVGMDSLAATFAKQGRLQEAEKLRVEVLEILKAKFGTDHPDILSSMSNLAINFRRQGRLQEAEKLQVKVLEARKAKFGTDHPHTLLIMNNLATTWHDQQRLQEAAKLQVEVLEARKAKLGTDHPDTLSSMGNLAYTWKLQHRDEAALGLMKDCAQRRRQILGSNHPDTVDSFAVVADWSNDNKGTGSNDNKGTGSNDNKGTGSNDNKGTGSNDNKGTGSNDNKGTGSNDNKGTGSNDNKGTGSNDNKGTGSNDNKGTGKRGASYMWHRMVSGLDNRLSKIGQRK
ncbi:hypothetical protein RB595_010336 [Gaeumannomyces hyphopodioides]